MKLTSRIGLLAVLVLGGSLAALAPAAALTLQQAQAELAGMSCSGSTCTSTAAGTRTEVVPGGAIYSPATEGKPAKQVDAYNDVCKGPMTFGEIVSVGGVLTCIPGSSVGSGGGGGLVGYHPDGAKSVDTITTTTKTLTYNGPNTSRDTAWSVDTTVVVTDAP